MAYPHRNATRRHTTPANQGARFRPTPTNPEPNVRQSPGCPRLVKMRHQQGNYAAARHLAKRDYPLELALDLLGMPRRF